MSVKRLLSAQSNARSELRAELTENNRLPNLNIQRRHKIRKYNLPENWHVEFKNKCFYCDQHVNGIDGMKGHIRSCKTKLVLEAQEEGDLLYDNINQDEGFDTEVQIAQIEYYVKSLSIINRPAFVVPESALASDNFRFRIEDLKECRFTSIPYAFLDRSGWSDIRRGVTCAETELKAGESKRVVPFSTNSSDARNKILNKIIFKRLGIKHTSDSMTASKNDHDDEDDHDVSVDSEQDIDEMYEYGINRDQFQYLR